MSGATYRIEADNTPGDVYDWYVKVYRLSDDFVPVWTQHHSDPQIGIANAREWIRLQQQMRQPSILYVDDDGRDADAPHSVKVTE